MKKRFGILVVCLFSICCMAFAGCTSQTTTTPAYVNVYYTGGEKSEKNYIMLDASNIWKVVEENIPTLGSYIVDGNEIKCYNFDGTTKTELTGKYVDSNWVVTYNGVDYIKEKTNDSGCQSSGASSYIFLGLSVVVIILLFVWPSISSKKRQQKAMETVNALKVGDRVKTIGGVCGFVAAIDNLENTFILETKSNDKSSFIKFDKGAIAQTAPAGGNGADSVPTQSDNKTENNKSIDAEKKVEPSDREKPKKKQRDDLDF